MQQRQATKRPVSSIVVMTGLGVYDFAEAAAVALRAEPKADITCTSAARLPARLKDYAGLPTPPSRIVILGIGLSADPAALGDALVSLVSHGTRIDWCSTKAFSGALPASVTENIHAFVSGNKDLLGAVAKAMGTDAHFARRLPEVYKELFEASQYAFRNYGDSEPYHAVVRHMAVADPETRWSVSERRLLEFCRQHGNRELDGRSPAILKLKDSIRKVAPFENARVMILGESGTGKETVALQIHALSPRAAEPMVAFNCASVSPELLESRFLGYEKGAFTGAVERKAGVFEMADGGTLFLDEIGELPPAAQGVLLRILEEGRFYRMGGRDEISVDVRVICATNRDLVQMVADGTFREDLFFRLSVIELRTPSLRDRKEDIGKIADGRWRRLGHPPLTDMQAQALISYEWPGNVRELMNVVERAHVLGTDFPALVAEEKERMAPASHKRGEIEDEPDSEKEIVARHARRVFAKYGNNIRKTSEALGISPNTLRERLGTAVSATPSHESPVATSRRQ